MLDRLSIELTNRCSKGCWFCYNHSSAGGATSWTVRELVDFVRDCATNDIRAVSFGGGEPLQFDGVFDVLHALRGQLFRSLTTNGLPLNDDATFGALVAARPEKVHVSIHFPNRAAEVDRVIAQTRRLAEQDIKSGINLLVSRNQLAAATDAAARIRAAGIGNDRIVYLPMRGHGGRETPSPREVAAVAGNERFQSMTCLGGCARSERFCSIGWDKTAAWCSYTNSRRPLPSLTHAGLLAALDGLGLDYCGAST